MKKITYLLLISLMAAALTSCNSCCVNKTGTTATAEGWITLFDGKTFEGWRGYNKDHVPALWIIEDGTMKINGSGGNEGTEGGGDIMIDRKFKNFEFEAEWKAKDEASNSGIMYLAQEIPGLPMYASAPEYQVLGIKENTVGKGQPASLYDMIAADPQNANHAGQWNKARIIVNNGHVEHWQNDVKVVEYELWGEQWANLLNDSKFSKDKWPAAYELFINLGGPNHEGYIGFQDHGGEVWYRNIRIKEL